jgi:hypothetical protein
VLAAGGSVDEQNAIWSVDSGMSALCKRNGFSRFQPVDGDFVSRIGKA